MMERASEAGESLHRGSGAESHQLDPYSHDNDTTGSSQDLPNESIAERTKQAIKLFSEQGEQLEGLREPLTLSIANLQVVCGLYHSKPCFILMLFGPRSILTRRRKRMGRLI
jgi:hypothetical protein